MCWLPASWKQEKVPNQTWVHIKGWGEKKSCGKGEFYTGFINSVSSQGGEREMDWGGGDQISQDALLPSNIFTESGLCPAFTEDKLTGSGLDRFLIGALSATPRTAWCNTVATSHVWLSEFKLKIIQILKNQKFSLQLCKPPL